MALGYGYFVNENAQGFFTINTMRDDLGADNEVNYSVVNDLAASQQGFFAVYPTSLLEGSSRLFKAFSARNFISGGSSRTFKS